MVKNEGLLRKRLSGTYGAIQKAKDSLVKRILCQRFLLSFYCFFLLFFLSFSFSSFSFLSFPLQASRRTGSSSLFSQNHVVVDLRSKPANCKQVPRSARHQQVLASTCHQHLHLSRLVFFSTDVPERKRGEQLNLFSFRTPHSPPTVILPSYHRFKLAGSESKRVFRFGPQTHHSTGAPAWYVWI